MESNLTQTRKHAQDISSHLGTYEPRQCRDQDDTHDRVHSSHLIHQIFDALSGNKFHSIIKGLKNAVGIDTTQSI